MSVSNPFQRYFVKLRGLKMCPAAECFLGQNLELPLQEAPQSQWTKTHSGPCRWHRRSDAKRRLLPDAERGANVLVSVQSANKTPTANFKTGVFV